MRYYKYFITNSLPFTEIKTNIYENVNNKASLEIENTNWIPYGTIARMILLYLTTEIYNQKTKKIFIGKTFNKFMKNCGYNPVGGRNSNIAIFKEQFKRIISSNFKIKTLEGNTIKFNFIQETNKFNGYLEIDEDFYNSVMNK